MNIMEKIIRNLNVDVYVCRGRYADKKTEMSKFKTPKENRFTNFLQTVENIDFFKSK